MLEQLIIIGSSGLGKEVASRPLETEDLGEIGYFMDLLTVPGIKAM